MLSFPERFVCQAAVALTAAALAGCASQGPSQAVDPARDTGGAQVQNNAVPGVAQGDACMVEGQGSTDFEDARLGARSCCAGLQKVYRTEASPAGACLASKGGRYTCCRDADCGHPGSCP